MPAPSCQIQGSSSTFQMQLCVGPVENFSELHCSLRLFSVLHFLFRRSFSVFPFLFRRRSQTHPPPAEGFSACPASSPFIPHRCFPNKPLLCLIPCWHLLLRGPKRAPLLQGFLPIHPFKNRPASMVLYYLFIDHISSIFPCH